MKNLEKEIETYLTERGWDKMTPSDMAKSISIEAAELLEIFQWDNKDIAVTKLDIDRMVKIKEELADIFIYCLDMAVLLNIDSESIIREKLKYNKNKYPAKEMKDSEGNEQYLKLKKRYRDGNRT